jgi:hypothetical protein
MKENSLNNTLNRIVNLKEKAKKEGRYYDETVFRSIEVKLIKKLKNER